jgi:hypothetical protein
MLVAAFLHARRMLVSGILLAVAVIVAGCAPKATTKGLDP